MGGVASGVGGLLGGIAGSQHDSGSDVGSNIFSQAGMTPEAQAAYSRLGQYGLQSTANQGMTLANQNSMDNSTSQVQNNPMLGQLFGQGGLLQNSVGQTNDLMNRGYSLQPEDYEAYGQASGNVARLFGGQEQGLAQDMASRGMSNSGAAGQQFSNMYGNKQEQLSGLQTQIAQNRMQMNMQRLGQMQNFVGQLGNQAQGAIKGANDMQSRQAGQTYNQATDYMNKLQGVNQQAFDDRQNSMHPSTLSQGISGAMGGAGAGANFAGALGGSSGGNKGSLFAGQSSLNGGAIA